MEASIHCDLDRVPPAFQEGDRSATRQKAGDFMAQVWLTCNILLTRQGSRLQQGSQFVLLIQPHESHNLAQVVESPKTLLLRLSRSHKSKAGRYWEIRYEVQAWLTDGSHHRHSAPNFTHPHRLGVACTCTASCTRWSG
jgi:hypothetical protein